MLMKISVLMFTLFVSLLTAAPGAVPKQTITHEMVLEAIRSFLANPVSPNAQTAARLIKEFAETSPDVMVTISKKAVPLIDHPEIPISETAPLTAAFLVGNVRSQLLTGKKTNDSYAGGLQVIATYRQLQKRNPQLRISEIEKLIQLEKQGNLAAYLASP
jgi:hypothetical protein